jgi:hypothetical protein
VSGDAAPLDPVPAADGVARAAAVTDDAAPACPLPVHEATDRSTATVRGTAALPDASRCRILRL